MGEILARERNSLQTMEEPGDYVVRRDGSGTIVVLWAILPNGQMGRLAAKGANEPGAHWKFTEDEHGHVSATPSIHDIGRDIPLRQPWHGWLDHGTWRDA